MWDVGLVGWGGACVIHVNVQMDVVKKTPRASLRMFALFKEERETKCSYIT